MKCQHCLEPLEESWSYCPHCGAKQKVRAVGFSAFEPPIFLQIRDDDPDESHDEDTQP